jgi:hypothetical protein
VDHIPNAVEIWDLVSEKFYQVKAARNPDDPPIVEHVQPARQLGHPELLQKAKDRNGGV